MTESWTVRHFSQSNPEGEPGDDLAALLRRVADSVEALGEIDVQDVTFDNDQTDGRDWYSLTVYFHARTDD